MSHRLGGGEAAIVEVDLPGLRDGGGLVKLHQLV